MTGKGVEQQRTTPSTPRTGPRRDPNVPKSAVRAVPPRLLLLCLLLRNPWHAAQVDTARGISGVPVGRCLAHYRDDRIDRRRDRPDIPAPCSLARARRCGRESPPVNAAYRSRRSTAQKTKKRPRPGGYGPCCSVVVSGSVPPCPAGRLLGWVVGAATCGRERGQSSLSGGPSSDMSCFSKMAATTARSGVPLRVAGPSSS